MGAVYLARDLRLERDVAIKILTARSRGRLRGLTPEAWAMSTVTHPAVAQIYGVEVWRGRPCLVVEFLAGGTLEDRLRDGPLAPAQAVSVVARLADALAALHEKGVLHGDIKPSNIGFTAEGSPKLLDFGLAHAVDDAVLVGGTLPYLSPEVLTGHPAEDADDVWSLCVVLSEIVSGRQPFAGGTLEQVRNRIRRQRLAAGSAAAPSATAVVAFAASILTAPRAGRPGTAPAFAAALAAVQADCGHRRHDDCDGRQDRDARPHAGGPVEPCLHGHFSLRQAASRSPTATMAWAIACAAALVTPNRSIAA